MLHFGPYAGFGLLDLIGQHIQRIVLVQRLALARAHGHMPGDPPLGIRALFDSLVSRITKGNGFLPVQQCVSFSDIAHMTGYATYGMHQSGICIDTDMDLHAKVPLVALLAGVHLGVARFAFVLCRRWVPQSPGFDSSRQQIAHHSNEINHLAAILASFCNGANRKINRYLLLFYVGVIVVACSLS
jgi:hypothetical protein